MPSVFYNDRDPYVAQWLGNLVAAGRLPQTAADARSIVGGWLYALPLAGWPGDREVWTGRCPCQRFWKSKHKAPPEPSDDGRKISERGRIMAARNKRLDKARTMAPVSYRRQFGLRALER